MIAVLSLLIQLHEEEVGKVTKLSFKKNLTLSPLSVVLRLVEEVGEVTKFSLKIK